jgi:hypothetical protein
MANPNDYNLKQDRREIEALARRICAANPSLSYHQAYLKAVRMLGAVS